MGKNDHSQPKMQASSLCCWAIIKSQVPGILNISYHCLLLAMTSIYLSDTVVSSCHKQPSATFFFKDRYDNQSFLPFIRRRRPVMPRRPLSAEAGGAAIGSISLSLWKSDCDCDILMMMMMMMRMRMRMRMRMIRMMTTMRIRVRLRMSKWHFSEPCALSRYLPMVWTHGMGTKQFWANSGTTVWTREDARVNLRDVNSACRWLNSNQVRGFIVILHPWRLTWNITMEVWFRSFPFLFMGDLEVPCESSRV